MARAFKYTGKKGDRIPLAAFDKPIVVLRTEKIPSETDESWVRNASIIFKGFAAFEEGEIRAIRGDQRSSKELFLFVFPEDEVYSFTVSDFVVYGQKAYRLEGYEIVTMGGKRYFQLNTLPWATTMEVPLVYDGAVLTVNGAAVIAAEDSPFTLSDEPAPLTSPENGNMFWDK